ncbi:unnamed protein product [Rotaria sp. Silwood1]|nr:unnamed protein product [Rotaria sp. Silwood1]CAF3591261.1 unnamed protein product [Rotaria sp. Silwood1]CAF4593213.1 unnamed protein product [Rotaria sp. Silwood1]
MTSDLNESDIKLTTEDIDTALRLIQQPAIIDQSMTEFLRGKSKDITTCILHTFQQSPKEYVIENITLVHNEVLYHNYSMCSIDTEERILFHGTKKTNFDDIFDDNLKNFTIINRRTDNGWYGRGIYFSSSPHYCVTYTRSEHRIIYLLCCLVKLGRIFHVKDMSYKGKEIRKDADSHYAQVNDAGYLIQAGEHNVYEEFAVKESKQIFPMIIAGLRPVNRFVVWRDAKIANGSNPTLIQTLKQQYGFNIYGCESSTDAINILMCKLNDPLMRCAVLTNGGNEAEQFIDCCQAIRSTIPIMIYCVQVEYHKAWTEKKGGEPKIQVTGCPNDVFLFINAAFSEELD